MKILILGGTGAMGIHATKLLSGLGHQVFVTSRKERSSFENVEYLKGDAKDSTFLGKLLDQSWDAIIDFMIWSTEEFSANCQMFLASTKQYIFLSSYRVYADSSVITEESPRLLDVCDDKEYLATDEYALAKARCEDILVSSGLKNWTIVRPAITYDGSGRFQLGVHEANLWLWRALHGISVPFPDTMLEKQATMTWGGDVARMIARLVGNSKAIAEIFTVSTSEHKTWAEIAEIYKKIVQSLKLASCKLDKFERERGGKYQIRYDRMFDRVVDNSKVLDTVALSQTDLISLEDGLASELESYLKNRPNILGAPGANARMDRLIGGCPSLFPLLKEQGVVAVAKYLIRRCF